MGVYSRVIFPRLCDWVMNDPRMARLRTDLLADVGGKVLEIGFGTGLNLPHRANASNLQVLASQELRNSVTSYTKLQPLVLQQLANLVR
jgi:hypothetical protein